MYKRSSIRGDTPWRPYKIDSANNNEEIWELDEHGEKIEHIHSPYFVRNIENEKRYLLQFEHGDIPAVKRDGKYLNLVSNCKFEIENGVPTEKQPTVWVPFFIGNEFDL